MDHESLKTCTESYGISNITRKTLSISDFSNQKIEIPCLEGQIQLLNESSFIRIMAQRGQALTVFITHSKVDQFAAFGLDAANRFLTENFISGKVIEKDNKFFLVSTIFVDELEEGNEVAANFEDEDFMSEKISQNHLDHIAYCLQLMYVEKKQLEMCPRKHLFMRQELPKTEVSVQLADLDQSVFVSEDQILDEWVPLSHSQITQKQFSIEIQSIMSNMMKKDQIFTKIPLNLAYFDRSSNSLHFSTTNILPYIESNIKDQGQFISVFNSAIQEFYEGTNAVEINPTELEKEIESEKSPHLENLFLNVWNSKKVILVRASDHTTAIGDYQFMQRNKQFSRCYGVVRQHDRSYLVIKDYETNLRMLIQKDMQAAADILIKTASSLHILHIHGLSHGNLTLEAIQVSGVQPRLQLFSAGTPKNDVRAFGSLLYCLIEPIPDNTDRMNLISLSKQYEIPRMVSLIRDCWYYNPKIDKLNMKDVGEQLKEIKKTLPNQD